MIIDKQVVFLKDLDDLVFITKENAEKAGLPLSIICNQYGINADNSSNVNTYIQAGTIGNLNLAYSIEIPNSGIRRITPQTADPFMTTNFASVKTTLNSYNMPIFARSFLINNFYIIKISDFGNQSLSFDSFDFFVKVYYEGRKIPQFRVGLIRRFASKEAFILIDKRGLPGSVAKDKFSYVIEPITKDAPKDEPKDKSTTYKQITNNGDRYFNLENYISFLEAQIVYANNSNTDSYKYNLSEIIYDVLMDKRFEVYYKNDDGNYQKINSKYYASLFASKITKASDKNNADIISDGDDLTNTNLSSSLVSFQTHHQHPSTRDEELNICNFDYYKYLRDYLYDVKIFDNIDEEMRRTATIALAGIFNVPEETVKKFYILDRSTLPEYYLYEVSGTTEVTLKLTDIFATDITDFEVYYFPVANQATRYIEYGYRLPFASTLADKSFTVNSSGEITIKLHSDLSDLVSNYALIEIIPKHDNYSHLVGYCSSEINCSPEINSIDNIRGMLKARHIFGFNFIDEKQNSIELYSSDDNGLILTDTDTEKFSAFDLNISASEELDDSLSITKNDTALANDSSEYSPITTGNIELLLYTDPMLNLNKNIEDKTSEYILYPNDVSNILTENELKFIRNSDSDAKNKFTITFGTNDAEKVDSETDYLELADSIAKIRGTINNIYSNAKTVESNMNMIRNNLLTIFSGNESAESKNAFAHTIEYNSNNVPACIKIEFSGINDPKPGFKRMINVLEFQLNDETITEITKYNFEQYDYMSEFIYVPIYTSPISIKIFVTEYDSDKNSYAIKSNIKYYNYTVQPAA